jgi:chemotaxis protein MotA
MLVIVCVSGGYFLAHGNFLVLLQPAEFMIIMGAAVGAFIIGTPLPIMKKVARGIATGVTGKGGGHALYMNLLKVLYEFGSLVRKEGILAMENHVENAANSEILRDINHRVELVDFMRDSLRLVLMGIPTEDLVRMIDTDIEVREEESNEPHEAVAVIADSLPGLGIVAAVLGIIITMNSIGGESATVGKHVAAALVGTFLGVLLSYGFVGPLARVVKNEVHRDLVLMRVARVGILSISLGDNPLIICESARRAIPMAERPEFKLMEDTLRKR